MTVHDLGATINGLEIPKNPAINGPHHSPSGRPRELGQLSMVIEENSRNDK